MEPWLTRHMYVHVGGHGDFLRLIFSRAIEKIILTNKFLHFARHSPYTCNIYILYMVICLLILL